MGDRCGLSQDRREPFARPTKEAEDNWRTARRSRDSAILVEQDRLIKILTPIASHDGPGLQRAAHALKGSIANFAARGAFEAALRLETMGRHDELTGAKEACLSLEGEVARLQRALAVVAASKRGKARRQRRDLAEAQPKKTTSRPHRGKGRGRP